MVESERGALSALPSRTARAIAFIAILIGGAAGGLIGFGFMDLSGAGSTGDALGALACALAFAAGTAVIAVLGLRAMGEWREIRDRDRRDRVPGASGDDQP